MSSNLYEIYRANTMQLASTLVIKSTGSATALNNGLLEYRREVDTTRPETWMYYLNLAGEYHPENTMMRVLSLDTLEEIDFTKANLLEHRTTAREYTYGSTYYKELARKYPDQLALIRGIINPVDLQTAINAPDHAILYYDNSLVESWEENLIPELQNWIDGYVRKYVHHDFSLVEDLYLASALVQMHLRIAPVIMMIRQLNCRTNYVHSFHLWSYLASHNYLDDYREFLIREQAMWLYRDIGWIDHNNGKQSTMGNLIDNALTIRGFPIGEYGMIANGEDIVEDFYPKAELNFTPLNFHREQEVVHDNKTVKEILTKELPLARDNPDNFSYAESKINFKFTRGLMGQIPSKVLESEVTDVSLMTPVRMIDTLYNHWVYYACNGTYQTMINVQNPRTGNRMVMSVKDAWVAFSYCLNRAFGVTLTQVIPAGVWDTLQVKVPTFKTLRALAEPYYVSDDLIRTAMDIAPLQRKLVSTESFYLKCVEIHDAQLAHRELYSLRESFHSRAQMEGVCRRLYGDQLCEFAPAGTSVEQFFKVRNWDLAGYDDSTYMAIAVDILNTATGQDLFYSKSLTEIHAAMLRLFLQLSSYTIHAIQSINSIPAMVSDWRVIRVGDLDVYGYSRHKHPWMPTNVKKWSAESGHQTDYQLTGQGSQYTASVKSDAAISIPSDVDINVRSGMVTRIRIHGPSVYIRAARPRAIEDVLKKPALDGLLDWEFNNASGKTLTKPNLDGLDDFTN